MDATTTLAHQLIEEIMAIADRRLGWQGYHKAEVERDPHKYVISLLSQVKEELQDPELYFSTIPSTVQWAAIRVGKASELIAQHERETAIE